MLNSLSEKGPFVVVAHSGKQHAYRHAAALQRAGALARFVTSGYYKPDMFPDKLLGVFPWLDQRLRRRTLASVDSGKVVRRWRFELPELIARGFAGNSPLAARLVMRRDARFDRWVARHWAGAGSVFWGFQGSCLDSLRAARRGGALAVAEFAAAHVTTVTEILVKEVERHPEWAGTIGIFLYPDWYRERLEQEPHAADFCVAASSFCRQSLLRAGVDAAKIKLLPLGVDLEHFPYARRTSTEPFRVMFAGAVSQHKGIKYLLEAYRRIRNSGTELVLAGSLPSAAAAPLTPYRAMFQYLGQLAPRDLAREMHRAHVLVLPSVSEGFGLVIPEAMATGMPVIASTHSIGPELVREGQDGYVLAPDDVEGLATKLDWLASHRHEACQMGDEAAERAKAMTWETHAQRVLEILRELAAVTMKQCRLP